MRRRRRLRRGSARLRWGMARAGLTAFLAMSTSWPGMIDAQVVTGGAEPADTLTLTDALAATLERDPRLMAARAGVDAAAAGRAEARAAWLPWLATSGVVARVPLTVEGGGSGESPC